MILFEGMDCVGKTSVAKIFLEKTKQWSYRGHTRPPMHPFTYFSNFTSDSHGRVIVDRLHPTERAYWRTYRPDQSAMEMSQMQFRLLDLMLATTGSTLVYLYDDVDSIKNRWGKDQIYEWNDDVQRKLSAEMNESVNMSKLPTFRGTYTDFTRALDGFENELSSHGDAILQAALARTEERIGMPPPSIAMGNHKGIMYIGEGQNNNHAIKTYSGQCPFSDGPSAEFFWQALDGAEIPWWRGFYTNADEFDPDTMKELVDKVRPRTVVCLGKKAKELLSFAFNGAHVFSTPEEVPLDERRSQTQFRPNVHFLTHPMAVKRFGGKNALRDYSQVLRETIQYDKFKHGK